MASVVGAAFLAAGVAGVQAIAAPAPALTVAVPEKVDNFQLTDQTLHLDDGGALIGKQGRCQRPRNDGRQIEDRKAGLLKDCLAQLHDGRFVIDHQDGRGNGWWDDGLLS